MTWEAAICSMRNGAPLGSARMDLCWLIRVISFPYTSSETQMYSKTSFAGKTSKVASK